MVATSESGDARGERRAGEARDRRDRTRCHHRLHRDAGHDVPRTACIVQDHLGAHNAWGFRSGGRVQRFLFTDSQRRRQPDCGGTHKKVLVIGADTMSRIIDYQDRATCVFLATGRARCCWSLRKMERRRFIDFLGEIDGSGGRYLYMPAGAAGARQRGDCAGKMHYVHQEASRFSNTQCERCMKCPRRCWSETVLTTADITF